jgi:hypothetical protein
MRITRLSRQILIVTLTIGLLSITAQAQLHARALSSTPTFSWKRFILLTAIVLCSQPQSLRQANLLI